jgi:polyhydroxyalkanoate synthase
LFLDMVQEQTAGDPARLARALKGLRKYQEAERGPARELPAAVAQVRGAGLRDYGGGAGRGRPVLFVPSLINPPNILDLSEERSLLRWLAAEGGVRPLLLDWGWDLEARRGLGIAGHVEEILIPLASELGAAPALVGYCLGGTMALAAAAAMPVAGVATIAAPWRFSGFPDEARARLAGLWSAAKGTAEALGVLPMEALQSAFWSLDPARTVRKFEDFADMEGAKAAAFVALEDWANDGPPLGLEAARALFEDLFAADMTGHGEWQVGGAKVVPGALPCPVLEIVSTVDRIVPAASAYGAGDRIELALGHVGMVVGSRAKEALWAPLAGWLSRLGPSC